MGAPFLKLKGGIGPFQVDSYVWNKRERAIYINSLHQLDVFFGLQPNAFSQNSATIGSKVRTLPVS